MTLFKVLLSLALITVVSSQGLYSCIANYNPNTDQVLSGSQYVLNPSFESGRLPWYAQDSEGWDRIYADDEIYGACGKWVAKITKDASRANCARPNAAVWQVAIVNQTIVKSLQLSGWAFGVGVSGTSNPSDYSMYADLTYQDGSHSYMVYAPFDPSIDKLWQYVSVVITPLRPLYSVNVYGLFRATTVGKVYFDNFSLRTVTIKATAAPTTAAPTTAAPTTAAPTTAAPTTAAPTTAAPTTAAPTPVPTNSPTAPLKLTETQYYNRDCTGSVTYKATFLNGECNTNQVLDDGSHGSARWILNGNVVSQCSYYLNTSGCSQDSPAINPCSDHSLGTCLFGKVFSIASSSEPINNCDVSMTLVKDSQNLNNSVYTTVYTIQIKNQGSCTLRSLRIRITVLSGSTYSPKDGLTYTSDGTYYVNGANGLAPNQPYSNTTFSATGGNSPPIVDQISTTCDC